MHKTLWAGALSFEGGSWLLLNSRASDLHTLLTYFLLHAAGCALLAVALAPLVPAQYAKPRKWLLGLLFAFNFFAPVAGLVCIAGGFLINALMPRFVADDTFARIATPRFNTHRNTEGTGFRGGQVRAQLANDSAPVASRLQALAAVQNTPARMTGALLRELLADPIDDVRLLAYGMLDGKEKEISAKILAAREALAGLEDSTDTLDERRITNKQIAEYYWELIYQNLVQGDMLKFAAGESYHHAQAALDLNSDDAGLWFMRGRLALTIDDLPQAARALDEAQARGFPRERMLPYLAEQLYKQGEFSAVRRLFGELRGRPAVPALAALRRYWGPV